MPDDFCLIHGYDHMRPGNGWGEIPHCTACDDDTEFDGEPACTGPKGHEFVCTGTQYGGDDESYHGEGRCYCVHCGADGDA